MSDALVLVVEDEASFVEALTIGLRREGFEVAVAVDGAEALERFDEINPDLVLLDVMLPKISGVDVCRQLRKRTQVPIIMVTAKGAEIDTVVGLEVGADDYVTKPYRLRELVATTMPSRSWSPTRASASRPVTSIGCSSASTGSTRPAVARPVEPDSGCRSCATLRRTTAATCSCRRRRARARPSCCDCPRASSFRRPRRACPMPPDPVIEE